VRSEDRINGELFCKDMRKHVFQRRIGKIVCSHTAACAKIETEQKEKRRRGRAQGLGDPCKKSTAKGGGGKAAKGVGGSMLL